MVEQIKDKLENTNSGICIQLKESSERYTRIKEALQSYEYDKQLKDLDETKDDGSLIGLQEKYGNSVSFGDAHTPVYKIGLRFRF